MDRDREMLRRVIDPAHTAVLTMELQNGTCGPQAILGALAQEVDRSGMLSVVRRVLDGARAAGVRVVHCTHETRPDGAGTAVNCKIFALGEKLRREGRAATEMGTPGSQVLDGLLDPHDLVVPRITGMTPFTSTSLDQVLRNLGITTVVATGVSVNLGIFGMALSALDLGYQVVVVRDAVVGVPPEYAQSVIENSLSLISTVTTADELLAVLAESAPAAV